MTVPDSQLLNDRDRRLTDWGETLKPSIYNNSVLYELPLPVLTLRIRDAWDFERLKVPLADGNFLAGHSRQGAEISISGQIGLQAGVVKSTQAEMFAEIENLHTALEVPSSTEKYSFFLFHDVQAAFYRKYKTCTTVRFDYDLSNKNLFMYSLVIHAEDPVIYTTAPGL